MDEVVVMECVVDFNGIRFDFAQNRFKQKMLIEILTRYMSFEITELSRVLDVPVSLLDQVKQGKKFLHCRAARDLGRLFLLSLSSPGRS